MVALTFNLEMNITQSRPHVGRCHKRQKPQAPTPQAPIRNRQTRKVANARKRQSS